MLMTLIHPRGTVATTNTGSHYQPLDMFAGPSQFHWLFLIPQPKWRITDTCFPSQREGKNRGCSEEKNLCPCPLLLAIVSLPKIGLALLWKIKWEKNKGKEEGRGRKMGCGKWEEAEEEVGVRRGRGGGKRKWRVYWKPGLAGTVLKLYLLYFCQSPLRSRKFLFLLCQFADE